MANREEYLLELEDISKSFRNVNANDGISLKLAKGEILALLGENGAGKSTLMNIIYGIYRPDNGKIFINGEEAQSYTFAQDYYFMMGDNRHNSLDSRYWGFVPEDHIVGKPALIWLSIDGNKTFPNNIRWRRFFKFV